MWLLASIHDLVDSWTKGLTGLTAGGRSQSFPYGSFQHGQKGRESLRKIDIIILCNVIVEAMSHPLCCIILVRNKSQLPPAHKGLGVYTRAWKPVGGNPRGHLGICLPHKDTVLREVTRKAV